MKKSSWFANDDISTNVLSRLSAKKLQKLKIVSKEWRKLICDRSFISIQSQKKEPISGVFLQDTLKHTNGGGEDINFITIDTETPNVKMSFLDCIPEKVLLASCSNSLLCCQSHHLNPDPKIFVCNPLIRQYTCVEWPSKIIEKRRNVGLIFNPSQKPVGQTTNFKLVLVPEVKKGRKYYFFFHIYYSKIGKWIASEEMARRGVSESAHVGPGVIVEGIIYWNIEVAFKILSFDPQTWSSLLIAAPVKCRKFKIFPDMIVGESHGKLCFVVISTHDIEVWSLQDNLRYLWELDFSILLRDFSREYPTFGRNLSTNMRSPIEGDTAWMKPLAFKDGNLILRLGDYIYLYDVEKRTLKRLCYLYRVLPLFKYMYPIVLPYAMSLVPMHS